MTLDELTTIQHEALDAENAASRKTAAASHIANHRKADEPLYMSLKDLRNYDSAQTRTEALVYAESVLRDDLLLIAELRLESEARALKSKAHALRAQVSTYLDQ